MARRDRYVSRISKQFPTGSIKLEEEPPRKNIIKFVLFMLWQSLLHGRNRK